MTIRYRSLTFRLLGRAGSQVLALLDVQHEEFPICLLTMLSDRTVAPDLSESLNTPCDLDGWSKGFLNFFSGVLGNAESTPALRLIAHVAYTDIVQIEQRHAVLRRRLKVMGPTHVPSSSDVVSRIAKRPHRYSKLKCRQVHEMNVRAETPKEPKPSLSRTQKGSGGTWRAFEKERTMGQKRPDFGSLEQNHQ